LGPYYKVLNIKESTYIEVLSRHKKPRGNHGAPQSGFLILASVLAFTTHEVAAQGGKQRTEVAEKVFFLRDHHFVNQGCLFVGDLDTHRAQHGHHGKCRTGGGEAVDQGGPLDDLTRCLFDQLEDFGGNVVFRNREVVVLRGQTRIALLRYGDFTPSRDDLLAVRVDWHCQLVVPLQIEGEWVGMVAAHRADQLAAVFLCAEDDSFAPDTGCTQQVARYQVVEYFLQLFFVQGVLLWGVNDPCIAWAFFIL
jgi:hypothetical protein